MTHTNWQSVLYVVIDKLNDINKSNDGGNNTANKVNFIKPMGAS